MTYPLKVNIKGIKNINNLNNFIKPHNIRLILFAETHGFLNEIPIQKKIIKQIKPDFFLYEMLEEKKILNDKDAKKFLGTSDDKDFSVISTYRELKPAIKFARDFNLPIIGCDIKNMCCKNKDWIKKRFTARERKMIIKKRELKQSKIINQYTQKGLVFASLGAYHLRKGSLLLNKLKEKNFLMVNPLFDGKENFLIPPNKKKLRISYNIKLIEN